MFSRPLLALTAALGLLFAVSPPAAGAATLVHLWKADGDFTDAVGGNHGSGVGDTTFGTGQSGQAFSFDGNDDYVSVPDAPTHHFVGSFSVDAWAKTTSAAGFQQIAVYYDCAQFCPGNPSYYALAISNGKAYGGVRDSEAVGNISAQSVTGGPDIADGTFHRLSLVRDVEAGKLTLYVDGVLAAIGDLEAKADGAITNADAEADPLTIGTQLEGGTTTPVVEFNGLVDEVRLWSGALFQAGTVTFGSDLTRDPLAPPARQCTLSDPGPCTDVALSFHSNNLYPAQAPISGAITSVRYRSNTADQATLRLARLDSSGDATGAGTGPTVITETNGAITEVPVNPGLPVQEGDYLAGQGSTTTAFNCDNVGGSFDLYLPPLVNGGPFRSPTSANSLCEILVQATIEPDIDRDGLGDTSQDNCQGLASSDATDTDADALGDACDPDDDNDGVADGSDNCRLIANPSQANADGDASGDACDLTPNPATSAALRQTLDTLPPPVVGRLANVEPLSGVVFVAFPAGTPAGVSARASQKGLTFVPLAQARQIPVGSFLDTKRGTVRLRTATGSRNGTQTGDFTRGLFQVLQSRRGSARGLTDLVLKGGSFARSRCGSPGRAQAAALRRRTVRRLRSNARGRFRTRGRHSAATVRGTVWETTDRCDGTLTKVTRGSVVVRDLRRRRNIVVRAGRSYLAKATR